MRLDTEEPLRDFLTDILANCKIDKYHLKMQRKNQFVKMSFYELVLFWSVLQTEIYLSFRLSCPNAINPAVTARGSIISCSPNGSVTME